MNCNPTCLIEVLPGTREETDGTTVWVVVLVTLVVAAALLMTGKIISADAR